MKTNPLVFHWNLPIEGIKAKEAEATVSGAIDYDCLKDFVKTADELPIDSLLTPFGFHMPDPIPLLAALSNECGRVKFMLAYRSGLMSPTLFTQQINTLSHLLKGRLHLNMIAGFSPAEQAYYGDHLAHDERYERAAEFMSVCHSLWGGTEGVHFKGKHYDIRDGKLNTRFWPADTTQPPRPRIYLSGNSKIAELTAQNHADCWLRYGDTPEKIADAATKSKLPLGLRMSVIARPTREEAMEAAFKVVENPDLKWRAFIQNFIESCDSKAVKDTHTLAEKTPSEWLSPTIWTGAVPYRGGPALAIVGSFEEVANTLLEFKRAGVQEFILSGWPTQKELVTFCKGVVPIVRKLESLSKKVA